MNARIPFAAGYFYPSEPEELSNMLSYLFNKTESKKIKNLKALIVPHAGYIYSGITAAHAYKTLKESYNGKTFLIIGPSHYFYFENAITSNYNEWITPIKDIKSKAIEGFPIRNDIMLKEHSIEVQLPFLAYSFEDPIIYPLMTGVITDKEAIVNNLLKLIEDDTIMIISSDLSHYLPYESAISKDKATLNHILNKDEKGFDKYGDACGKEGIKILLHIANLLKWNATLLDYRNSGDTGGGKNEVVGYGAVAFFE